MRLHWDLAKRLMMGSKRDAATRMSALMALGLMCLTALGATLVVSGNKGLQDALAESIADTHAQPDGSIRIVFSSRAERADTDQQARLAALRADLDQEVRNAGGEVLSYSRLAAVAVPSEHLAALQQMWLDRAGAATTRNQSLAAKTRADRILARKAVSKAEKEANKKAASMGAVYPTFCVVPGFHPPAGEAWAIRSKSLGGMVPPRLDTVYSVMASSANAGFSMPVVQSLRLSKVVDRSPALPVSCGWLLPPVAAERIAIRIPTAVSEIIDWWAEPDMKDFFAQRNLEDSTMDTDLYKKQWGDTAVQLTGVWLKDYMVGNTIEQEATLDLIGIVSWTVVGVLAAISAYQMCSLLILLGVHFNFEVAMVRSMGFSRLDIGLVFLLASCLFAGVAALTGALSGLGVVYAYNEWFGLLAARYDFHGFILLAMPGLGFWFAMLVALVVGVIAGLFPSFLAARADPAVVWRDA